MLTAEEKQERERLRERVSYRPPEVRDWINRLIELERKDAACAVGIVRCHCCDDAVTTTLAVPFADGGHGCRKCCPWVDTPASRPDFDDEPTTRAGGNTTK